VVAVSATGADDRKDLATRFTSVSSEFKRLSPPWTVRFALSEVVNDLETLSETYEECRFALESRQQTDHPDPVFDVPSIGPFRLIVRAARGKESVEMARKVLEPIVRHEKIHGERLIHTFRAYLAANEGLTQTARDLKVHIHTVQQRLRRIEQLTNLNLHRSADRMTLELAVQILDLAGDQTARD
jgi:purine catabolism regulator